MPNGEELYKRYAGKYIGIIKRKIFAVAEDYQTLKDDIEKFLKEEEICRIRYIENCAILH